MTEFHLSPAHRCDLCESKRDLVCIECVDLHICSSCLQRAHAFLLGAVADRLPKQEPQPRQWELWMEGYLATSAISPTPPRLLATVTALSLDEAVQKHVNTLSKKDADYYSRRPDGTWSCWACRIYDNRKDATLEC